MKLSDFQWNAHIGNAPSEPLLERPLESEQHPYPSRFPTSLHQVRHIRYDSPVDICRDDFLDLLLA